MVWNIVNNTVRSGQARRALYQWDVPETSSSDLSLALKRVRGASPVDLRRVVAVLEEIGAGPDWLGEHYTELAARTGSPISFLRASVASVNTWLANVGSYLTRFGTPTEHGVLRGEESAYQGGIPTAMILAGDSTALTAWAIAQGLLSGSPLVVKPSNVEPLSAFLFTQAVLERGLDAPDLVHLDSSDLDDRALIGKAIRACGQSVVYGEDATVEAIYGPLELPTQHRRIPFWSGRSGAIVRPGADLALAARHIVEGAALDRGNMCLSTKKVFAPRSVRGELEALLVHAADAIRRGDPLDPATELGRLDPVARRLAEDRSAGSHVFYDQDIVLARCEDGSPLLQEETPYPIVGVRYYDDCEDAVEIANRTVRGTPSGRALVMSVFGPGPWSEAIRLRADKVLVNAPTSRIDRAQPHQGRHLTLSLMRPVAFPR